MRRWLWCAFGWRQVLSQPWAGHAAWGMRYVLRRAHGDDAPALRAAAWPHVDEAVSGGEQVQVVIDDDDRRPGLDEPVEYGDQRSHVERVQAGGRLVEDVQRAALAAVQPGSDPERNGPASSAAAGRRATRRTARGSGRTPRSRSRAWTARSGRSARRRPARPAGYRPSPDGGRARAAPSRQLCPRGGNETVEDESGLPGPGRPGHPGQPAYGEAGGDAVQVVQVPDFQGDLPVVSGPRRAGALHRLGAGQERADDGPRVGFERVRGALGDDHAAEFAGRRAKFDGPNRRCG